MKAIVSILLFSIAIISLQAAETQQIPAPSPNKSIPITLEFAKTRNETIWGLMQRSFMPKNHGMLFIYNQPIRGSIWAFNCLIDLSVAFIDSNHVILEIRELKAYPQKMDPLRPVKTVGDINRLYLANDPITRFFQANGINPSVTFQFALEMNKHWFQDNGVKPGDALFWDEATASGVIMRTME